MGFTKLLSKLSLTILISIKYAKLVGFTILISYFFSYYSYLALICILLLLVQNLGGSHPTHATIRSRKARQREVFRHHGLPESIISDRGPQFVSKFWKHLFKMVNVTYNLSSCYHPQTDGEAERTNQTLEQYLRCFLSYQQDDWADILHFAEFSYTNYPFLY